VDHRFELAPTDPQRADVTVGHERGDAPRPSNERRFPHDVASGAGGDAVTGSVCVIQAKRYKRVVEADAVRALWGAMEDKRTTEGILVTTSWFGSAGRQFAANHQERLRLIEGPELKHLLAEHLGLDVRIALERVETFLDLGRRDHERRCHQGGRVSRQRRYPSDLTDEQWALVEPPSSSRELLLMSAPERVPGRSSHWSIANMPAGTPAISTWRQIERRRGSSW
jgi:hypothetical protein